MKKNNSSLLVCHVLLLVLVTAFAGFVLFAGCGWGSGQVTALAELPTSEPEPPIIVAAAKDINAWVTDADGNLIEGAEIGGASALYINMDEVVASLAVPKSIVIKAESYPDSLSSETVVTNCPNAAGDVSVDWTCTKTSDDYPVIYKCELPSGTEFLTPASSCTLTLNLDQIVSSVVGDIEFAAETETMDFDTKCRTGYLQTTAALSNCVEWYWAGAKVTWPEFATHFNIAEFVGAHLTLGDAIEAIDGSLGSEAIMLWKWAVGASPDLSFNIEHSALSDTAEGVAFWMWNDTDYNAATMAVNEKYSSGALGGSSCSAQYGEDIFDDGMPTDAAIEFSGECDTSVTTKQFQIGFDAVSEKLLVEVDDVLFAWGEGGATEVSVAGFDRTKAVSIGLSYFTNVPGGGGGGEPPPLFLSVNVGKAGGGEEGETSYILTYKPATNYGDHAVDVNGNIMD